MKISRAFLLLLFAGCLLAACSPADPPLFEELPATYTGIDFANELIENDTHNILNFTNLYTGSGVGIGDFNHDGRPDVFLGGNQESSRMYLNTGEFKFEDVTENAKVTTNRWITGVAVVDINADDWDDIYLCVSGAADTLQRRNLLFINQQNGTFSEQAAAYGLDLQKQCTQANFLDYDKDGDLDVFIAVNPTDYQIYNVNNIRSKKEKGEAASTDILLRNNRISLPESKSDFPFTDVSKTAGVLIEGYSLGLNTSDLNDDGWPDIYVTNDFLTNDILYINNQDGTFTDHAAEMLQHTSFASMGIDVADVNNDGQPEIYVLDMFPEDNYRQKMIMGGGNYDRFRYMLQAGYQPQYSRNTLQLNNGDGTYSEIGQLAEVHKTDWSWSALLADYDNDGLRDLFVTNGFRRDLGDLDYINYSNTNPFGDPEAKRKDHLQHILEQPGALLNNYVFKNENGLQFSDRSAAWGLDASSYSHGAAYADFDGDGDLDLFIGGRVRPQAYPLSPASYLLENTDGQFSPVSSSAFAELGMVTTAQWADIDQDGDADLIVAGEFMPITIFKNNAGQLAMEPTIIAETSGWWNTLAVGDFDEDGDVDFLAGNLGLNTNYRASSAEPFCIYAKDFDENGSLDPVLCQFVDGVEYPVAARDKLIAQIPPMKRRFPNYTSYAAASIKELFKRPEMADVKVLEAQLLTSSWLENDGQGNFNVHPLPVEMQFAPINQLLIGDYNTDGHLDALVVGNSHTAEVATGRYDAFTGGVLLGDGHGHFALKKGAESGFLVTGAARALTRLQRSDRSPLFIVGNNDDYWQVFEKNESQSLHL